MARHKASKLYVFRFTVEGTGQFPFDMLRYDACFPLNENEANSLVYPDHTGRHGANRNPDALGRRSFRLQRVSPNPSGPTERRWESFGWHVTACESVNPST